MAWRWLVLLSTAGFVGSFPNRQDAVSARVQQFNASVAAPDRRLEGLPELVHRRLGFSDIDGTSPLSEHSPSSRCRLPFLLADRSALATDCAFDGP